MKTSEIRELSKEDLKNRINTTREELMNLRFQLATGTLADFTRLRQTRKMIAQMQTILAEKNATEEVGEA
jgi:large subunit ribosomal protein L29